MYARNALFHCDATLSATGRGMDSGRIGGEIHYSVEGPLTYGLVGTVAAPCSVTFRIGPGTAEPVCRPFP
jgi:hypothetical protein